MKKSLNIQKLFSACKKQISERNTQHKERRIPETDFQLLGENKIKYRTNEQGVFFDVETLELDVLYNIHDIYLDYFCSKHRSDGHPSTLEINTD